MKYIGRILFGLLGLVLAMIIIHGGVTMGLKGEKTECYDNNHNLIEGQTCIVDGAFETRQGSILVMSIIGILLLIIFIVLGIVLDHILTGEYY